MGKAHRLTQLAVDRKREPGLYCDGNGLWLRVTDAGGKYWILRYMVQGRQRWMGIGNYPDFSLADARNHASTARQKIHQGVDPIDERKAAVTKVRAERVKSVTFGWCAEQYIESHRAGWRNAKHAEQWTKTLRDYAGPVIGGLRVDQIDTARIMKILQPMWNEKPETASRLRGRIENVLDWAKVHQYRSGENPARWKGHLDKLLPARNKVKKERHHAAQPWQDMSSLMTKLRQQEGMGA